jgi:hypothetical protein
MRSEALYRVIPGSDDPAQCNAMRSGVNPCDAMPTGEVNRVNRIPALHSHGSGAASRRRDASGSRYLSLLVHLVDLVERDICSQPNGNSRCIASLRINRVRHHFNRVRRGFRSLGRPARPFRPIGLRAGEVSGPFDPTKPRAPEPGSTLRHPYRTPTRARASSRASDPCRSDWLSRVCGPNPASLSRGAVLPGLGVATVATAPLEPFSALPFGCDNARMFGSKCQTGRSAPSVRSGRSVGVMRGWSEKSQILGPRYPSARLSALVSHISSVSVWSAYP